MNREPLLKGKAESTVHLLVLTSLEQGLLNLPNLLFTKQATLMRRLTVLSLPFQWILHDINIRMCMREGKTEREMIKRGEWARCT